MKMTSMTKQSLMSDSFDFKESLQKDIAGQKRTGKTKQFVFIKGQFAIKGPYQEKRLNNVMERSLIFEKWNTPFVVKAIDKFETKDGVFVRFPNIMLGYNLEFDWYDEPFSGYRYKVLKNSPVIDIREALENNKWIFDQVEDLILAWCHCNILGVGDVNLGNTLVDPLKREFYLIDFDDNLGKDTDSPTFYFNKAPAKALKWYENVAYCYSNVASRLHPLLNDHFVAEKNLLDRVERAINLLLQYSVTDTTKTSETVSSNFDAGKASFEITSRQSLRSNFVSKSPFSPKPPATSPFAIRSPFTPKPSGTSPFATKSPFSPKPSATSPFASKSPFSPKPSTTSPFASKTPFSSKPSATSPFAAKTPNLSTFKGSAVLDQTISNTNAVLKGKFENQSKEGEDVVNILNGKNIGKMVWKGLRGGHSLTFSGEPFDVVKSAMQKYIRRQLTDRAVLAAVELYRFGELGDQAKAGVTNVFNRVSICANEDIGPANLPLVLEVTKIVESGNRDVATLAAMVQLLSESKKTRMMSHAWRAYATEEGRIVSKAHKLDVDSGFKHSDLEFIKNFSGDLFLSDDPNEMKTYILVFLKRVNDADLNAYYWAGMFLENFKDTTIKKRKKFLSKDLKGFTGKADILLWKVLSYFLDQQTHDILVNAYYKHSESRPFLQNAIMCALFRVKYQPFDVEPYVKNWRNSQQLQDFLDGKHTLVIEEYVIDKHTAKGRRAGATIDNFVNEGSLVVPQDERFYNKTLHDIYKTR